MLVPISDIRLGERLRSLREATVVGLVDSIGRLGLRVPISVVIGVEKREGTADGVSFTLVAGAHRLEACKRLGWTEIEAASVQLDDEECLLWEIDENLCRAELTELERGEHLLRRKEIYERKWPQTKQHVAGGHARQDTAGDNLSFAEDTAAKADIDQRTIQRSIRRARKIDAKVRDRVRAIPEIADSGVELDALAELDPAQQRRAVALVEAGQAYGIRDAKNSLAGTRRGMVRKGRKITLPWSARGAARLLVERWPASLVGDLIVAIEKRAALPSGDIPRPQRIVRAREYLAALGLNAADLEDGRDAPPIA